MTSEGHPGARLQRALAAGNLTAAEQAAFEVPFAPLAEARALVELYAQNGDRKFERAARRLLTRSPSTVEASARNPSHSTSNDQAVPVGIGQGRSSIGAGNTRQTNRSGSYAVELDPMAELPLGTLRTERKEASTPV